MTREVGVTEELYNNLQEVAKIWNERMADKLKKQLTPDDVFDMFMTAVFYFDRDQEVMH